MFQKVKTPKGNGYILGTDDDKVMVCIGKKDYTGRVRVPGNPCYHIWFKLDEIEIIPKEDQK